jgi:hypothetical protein
MVSIMTDTETKTLGAVGLVDDVDTLLSVAEKVRDSGHGKWDCHTPYPVHGLDRAMGLRTSPVPYVTLTAGFLGVVAAIAMTGGFSVFQYPIRIGGKALWSWQAFVPIFFELFVLFAALATMGSVVFFCRLGRWHSPLHDSGVMAEIVRDRYAVVLESDGERDDYGSLEELLRESGCGDVRPLVEFPEEEGPES